MRLHSKIITSLALILFSLSTVAQTQEQVDRMTKAVQFDDLAEVKKLIAAGVSPNLLVKGGNPLTVYAVKEKSKQTLDYLIELKGVDIDHPNLSGETVLMMASLYGMLPEVKVLVDKRGADINKSGWTPLHYACTEGHLAVVAAFATGLWLGGAKDGSALPMAQSIAFWGVLTALSAWFLVLRRGGPRV